MQLKMIKAGGGGERGKRRGGVRRSLSEMAGMGGGRVEADREMERERRADFSLGIVHFLVRK